MKGKIILVAAAALATGLCSCSNEDEPAKPEVFNVPSEVLPADEFKDLVKGSFWVVDKEYYLNENFEVVSENPDIMGAVYQKEKVDGTYFTEDGYLVQAWSKGAEKYSYTIKIEYSSKDGIVRYVEPGKSVENCMRVAVDGDVVMFVSDSDWSSVQDKSVKYHVAVMKKVPTDYVTLTGEYPVREWRK